MPRNSSGVYVKPAGTTAQAGQKIQSAPFNALVDDMVADLNAARPVTSGGTGATNAAQARANLGITPDGGGVLSEKVLILATRAGLALAVVDETVDAVRVQGGAAPGDGGAALWKRVASEPSHPGKLQSGDGAWWALAERRMHPEMLGALGNDIADDTAVFQSSVDFCIATGATLTGRSGATYRITAPVTVGGPFATLGGGAAIHFTPEDEDALVITGATAARIDGVTVSGWRVEMDDGLSAFIYARGTSNLTVDGNRVVGGRLLRTDLTADSPGATGASWDATKWNVAAITDDCLCRDISVTHNRAVGATTEVSPTRQSTAVVQLRFVDGFIVAENNLRSDRNGVTRWGGDSNPSRDGAKGSVRWARNGAISGNVITDMHLGGIWGSQGRNITASANTTERCRDIGVHSEGGQGVVVDSNVMRDCKNGGFNAYFIEEGCIYSNNSVFITDATTWGATLIKTNMGSADLDFDITIVGNHAEMLDPTAMGEARLQRGGTIKFSENILRNCVVNALEVNSGNRYIEDNQITLTRDPGTHVIAGGRTRHVGSDRPRVLSISRNRIEAYGFVSTDPHAFIFAEQSGENGDARTTTLIEENEFFGATIEGTVQKPFPADIITRTTAALGVHKFTVQRNGLWVGKIVDTSDLRGATAASFNNRVVHEDNHLIAATFDRSPYTGAPDHGVYALRSRLLMAAPGAGAYAARMAVGTVGVTGGTLGTWDSATAYALFDQVTGSDGRIYIAIAPSTNEDPVSDTDSDFWHNCAPSVSTFKGIWQVEA